MKADALSKKKKLTALCTIAASVAAGCVNGLFGGGGGMLVVPIFTVLLSLEVKKAHATAVAAILPMSVVSAIIYIVKGCVEWNITYSVGGGVIAGGVIGALLLKKVNNFLLSMVFYLIMIAAGVKMLIG
ncbi:MAG: sulfite exporter TauE/SafE family protein [Clostridia bacterium]|nr:sulfite exporter TauE/SafE family protein [Clostridia bacterium]